MSLLPRIRFSDRPCLVAIASISDLFDEASWVRCYAVDPSTTSLDREDRRVVGVQSYDGARRGMPTRIRMRVRDVRELEEALWLIVDNTSHVAPDEDWGRSFVEVHEIHDGAPELEGLGAERVQVDDDYRYIRRKNLASSLIGRVILWLVAGLGVPLLYLAGWGAAVVADVQLPTWLISGAAAVLVVWQTLWVALSGICVGAMVGTQAQAIEWRWRDGQRRRGDRAWRGGTTDCLVFGTIIRRGRVLGRKDWRGFWLSLRPED